MAYVFEHTADDGDRALVDACHNLSGWLDDHIGDTLEGYEVFDLDQATAESVAGAVEVEDLVGAAVGHESPHAAAALGGQNAVPHGSDLSVPHEDGTAGRSYHTDPACFDSQDCDWLESEEWSFDGQLPLGLTADVHWHQEWRWVELEAGTAMLQRFWLAEPVGFNVSFLEVEQQYFLWVFLPNADGTSRSVQATWIAARLVDAPVPESFALSLVVDEMSGQAARLDDAVAGIDAAGD